MATCTYHRNYIDFETKKEDTFQCEENVWKAGRCIFHSKKYLKKDTEKNLQEEFKKILIKAKKEGVLRCIGYHLPKISLLPLASSNENDIEVILYFNNTKFYEKIEFSNIIFKKQVSFIEAEFYKSSSFTASQFKKNAYFSDSKFMGDANSFQFTKFEKIADFSHGNIKNAKFNKTEFNEVNFNYRSFQNNTSFENAIFTKSMFKGTTFEESVDFSESIFLVSTNFDKTNFYGDANFNNVSIPKKTLFNGNVSKVSFLGIDISHIKFGNEISWKKIKNIESNLDKIKSYMNWIQNHNFKIYDERNLEKQFEKNIELKWWQRNKNVESRISLESIKNIYRDLRDNFDFNLRYETAGEFHVREIELKRKYREKHKDNGVITVKRHPFWKHLTIYWLYNILAQYGQSYHRPIYFGISIISIATYFFLSTEIESAIKDNVEYSLIELMLKSLARSVSALIPFDILDAENTNADKVLRVILLPISATFFISLKRRLERKFRH